MVHINYRQLRHVMHIPIGTYCVRSFQKEDAVSIAKYADNPGIAGMLRDIFPHPYTEKDAREWIAFVKKQKTEKPIAGTP